MKPPALFLSPLPGGGEAYHIDVESRTRVVKACEDPALLRAALDYIHLQKSVRTAIERRLRALEYASAAN